MRRILGVAGALGLALVVAGPGRAGEQADGMALVDRALRAQGGLARLKKFPALTWKTKGTFDQGNGVNATFTGEFSAQDLEHYRWEAEVAARVQSIPITLVVAGTKGWIKAVDKTQDLPADAVTLLREDFHAAVMAQRLWMLKDKVYRLSPLGELKVGDRDAVGVKVVRKGFPDIDLYFDKQTMLPAKGMVRLKEGKDGQEAVHEFYYRYYKKTRGIQQVTKLTLRRDDNKLLSIDLSDISFEEKLEDSLFAKP